MANVLNLQASVTEVPEEAKVSIQSWFFCGGTNPSNKSRVFC